MYLMCRLFKYLCTQSCTFSGHYNIKCVFVTCAPFCIFVFIPLNLIKYHVIAKKQSPIYHYKTKNETCSKKGDTHFKNCKICWLLRLHEHHDLEIFTNKNVFICDMCIIHRSELSGFLIVLKYGGHFQHLKNPDSNFLLTSYYLFNTCYAFHCQGQTHKESAYFFIFTSWRCLHVFFDFSSPQLFCSMLRFERANVCEPSSCLREFSISGNQQVTWLPMPNFFPQEKQKITLHIFASCSVCE